MLHALGVPEEQAEDFSSWMRADNVTRQIDELSQEHYISRPKEALEKAIEKLEDEESS